MFKKRAVAVLLGSALLTLSGCNTPSESSSSVPDETESSQPASSTPTVTDSSSPDEEGIVVSYSVAGEIVHTETLPEGGGVPVDYDYKPATGKLVDWYLTPSFSRAYLFEDPLTESTTLFGAVNVYQEDTMDYYIAGSGSSPILLSSNWGDTPTDQHKLVKDTTVTDENVYTITADLYKGDSFQVVSFLATETDPYSWNWQYGSGYVRLYEGVNTWIQSDGGLADSTRKSNIGILMDGNYTFTLHTYPNFEGIDAENKINNLNYLTIVRNGDCVEERPETILAYYIKGANITAWGNMYNEATQLVPNADQTAYTLEIYLREGEEFMFHTRATNAADGTTSDANIYINYNNLDTASAALFTHPESGTNIVATKSGTYTFSYVPGADNTAGTLSATLDEETGLTIGDYYINGTIANDTAEWGTSSVTESDGSTLMDTYKLTVDAENADLYTIKNLTFRVNDEFTIAAFTAGSTTTGEGWANQLASYNSTYLAPATEGFEAVSIQNLNAKCTVAGTYDIAFNVYSRIITITPTATAA